MKPPKTAYILLWFPKPSETFIFREVINLWNMGLDLKVFSLYGEITKGLSPEMQAVSPRVERLGIPFLKTAASDLLYWWKQDRRLVAELFRTVPVRRWGGYEKGGENLWAFLAAFRLARRFREEGIEHIHAPWANGPATAAWIASRLTGIPFSFTARAWDIYPPDGALKDKIQDATLVRSEIKTNLEYLRGFVDSDREKILVTYNGVPLEPVRDAEVAMKAPFRLTALGRFVGKKGYDFLIQACRILKDQGVEFNLTLAGDGPRGIQLKHLARKLDVADRVDFPGFVQYDKVSDLLDSTDIFLMPSIVHSSGDRDGIPTVIMEALMHRVPVVATDVSGIGELIEDADTGLLIPEKDSQAIASAVLRMAGDREAAIQMAERGRAKVLDQFNPDKNHKRVFDLYCEYFSPD
jgi:glycosyltransferase involved in cell wall biosynthesis